MDWIWGSMERDSIRMTPRLAEMAETTMGPIKKLEKCLRAQFW